MFAIGDKVVYGTEGVFVVSEYTDSPIDKNDKRVFYVLLPVERRDNNKIITPSEGGLTAIRSVINREEALELIEKIPDVDAVSVDKEKNRRDAYRAAMRDGGNEGLISIIKTVSSRRKEFALQKRRISETDTDFDFRARYCLISELCIALNKPFFEVEVIIEEKIG